MERVIGYGDGWICTSEGCDGMVCRGDGVWPEKGEGKRERKREREREKKKGKLKIKESFKRFFREREKMERTYFGKRNLERERERGYF